MASGDDEFAEMQANVESYAAEVSARESGNKRKIEVERDADNMKRVRHAAPESCRNEHWAENAPLAQADPPPCQANA